MTFRTFRRHSAVSLLLCAAALAARAGRAAPAETDISVAKQAFESAVSLESERHWAEAASKLRAAIAVKDTPGLRFHLAHCELEQGRLVEASLEYDRASELLAQGAKAPDVQKLLGPASAELKPRIPRITVELPPDLNTPSATLDGKAYPPSELALGVPLNPGRHVLRVTATGRRPFEQVFELREAEPVTVRPRLALAPLPVAPAAPAVPAALVSRESVVPPSTAPPSAVVPPPAVPSEPDKRSSPAKLYLLIAESVLTAAGLGVGIGGQVAASSASNRVAAAQHRIDAAAVNDGSACRRVELVGACTDLHSAISDHDDALVLSEVGFISAGVGAAAFITTWLLYPESSSHASSLHVQPVIGLGRIGVLGSF